MPIQPPIQLPAEDTPQPRRCTGSLRSVDAVVPAVAACALLAATATPAAAASVHGGRGPDAGTDHRCAGAFAVVAAILLGGTDLLARRRQ
jgi:hypothetical protein